MTPEAALLVTAVGVVAVGVCIGCIAARLMCLLAEEVVYLVGRLIRWLWRRAEARDRLRLARHTIKHRNTP